MPPSSLLTETLQAISVEGISKRTWLLAGETLGEHGWRLDGLDEAIPPEWPVEVVGLLFEIMRRVAWSQDRFLPLPPADWLLVPTSERRAIIALTARPVVDLPEGVDARATIREVIAVHPGLKRECDDYLHMVERGLPF